MKLSFLVGLELEPELPRLEKAYQKMIKLKSLLCSTGLRRLTRAIATDITCTSIMINGLNVRAENPSFTGKPKDIKSRLSSLLWHGGSVDDAWFSCASNQLLQFYKHG